MFRKVLILSVAVWMFSGSTAFAEGEPEALAAQQAANAAEDEAMEARLTTGVNEAEMMKVDAQTSLDAYEQTFGPQPSCRSYMTAANNHLTAAKAKETAGNGYYVIGENALGNGETHMMVEDWSSAHYSFGVAKTYFDYATPEYEDAKDLADTAKSGYSDVLVACGPI